jgi:hypothetical protein
MKSCQYALHSESIMNPKVHSKVPEAMSGLWPYLSNREPVKAVRKKEMKPCVLQGGELVCVERKQERGKRRDVPGDPCDRATAIC